jgi:hypothetical protein
VKLITSDVNYCFGAKYICVQTDATKHKQAQEKHGKPRLYVSNNNNNNNNNNNYQLTTEQASQYSKFGTMFKY